MGSNLSSTDSFDSINDGVAALKKGEIVILVDSHDRENEGDFVLAGSKATPEKINFMLKHGRGIMCTPITSEKAQVLGLHKMAQNTDKFDTPFTVSVDARTVSTGVSVSDRLKTIQLLASNNSKALDFVRPGHVFPLVSRPFGVLERAGHTEGTIDVLKLAKLPLAGVIVEIMNEDGSMARLPDLVALKKKFGLKMISIQQLVDYRLSNERLLEKIASPLLPTPFGAFKLFGFKDKVFGREYVGLVNGKISGKRNVLTRVHSACFTGDVLFSQRCDCHEQLVESLRLIGKNGGLLVYGLDQEGRGIGLLNKLRAYELQEKGLDTIEANTALGFAPDQRHYAMSAQVIKALEVKSVCLLTNNPAKAKELEHFGIDVSGILPLIVKETPFNKEYMQTKKNKMAHRL